MKKTLLCILLVLLSFALLTTCSQRNINSQLNSSSSIETSILSSITEKNDESGEIYNYSPQESQEERKTTALDPSLEEATQEQQDYTRFVDIYDSFALDSNNNLYVIEILDELGPKHTLLLENVRTFVESENQWYAPNIQTTDGRLWRTQYGQDSWEIRECKIEPEDVSYTLIKGNILMDDSGEYYLVNWDLTNDGSLTVHKNRLISLGLETTEILDICAPSSQRAIYLTVQGELYQITANGVQLLATDVLQIHVATFPQLSAVPTIWALTTNNTLLYHQSYETDILNEWKSVDGVENIIPAMSNPMLKMQDGSFVEFYSITHDNYDSPVYNLPDAFSTPEKLIITYVPIRQDDSGRYDTLQCVVVLSESGKIAVLLTE